MSAERPPIGYCGLGLMGLPMTLNLLRAGYRVTVWNRTAEKCGPAVRAGAVQAASPAEVARASGIIFLCVFDADAVEQVVFGEGGIAEGGDGTKVLVDLSTTDPERTRAMALRLKERCDMRWVDSPVTGGQKGAEEGSLVLFAGGAADDVEAVRPHVAPIARRLAHMGPTGAGQVTKLCNQIAVGIGLAVVAELLAFAQKGGVEVARLPEVFEGGFADSTLMRLHAPKMIARDFTPRGRSRTVLKDLDLIRSFAKGSGTPLPLTGLAAELWRLHVARGHGADDAVSIIALYDPAPDSSTHETA